MKIVYIGTVEFSRRALEKLTELNAQIVAVLTKEKSAYNADFADLTGICREKQLEYRLVSEINSKEVLDYIRGKDPDIIFCFGWSQLIKAELLRIPRFGVVGFHPALLPRNRGRHPIIWALALGLEKTGSSFFFMDEGADSGNILSQREIIIDYSDDAGSLYQKITATALEQIAEFFPQLMNHTFPSIEQDHSRANYWRKRNEKDGEIDWRMSSNSIYNLVRSLTKPYVGAHFMYQGNPVKVWQVEEVQSDEYRNIEPGKVLQVYSANSFLIKVGVGCIKVRNCDLAASVREGEYL